MSRFGYERSDFVLGMSLAEIILLLVFCFFAVTAEAEDPEAPLPPEVCESRLKECRAALESARAEQARLSRELEALQRRFDKLLTMVGIDPTNPPDDDTIGDILKRGKRKCSRTHNLLLHAKVLNGVETGTIGTMPRELSDHLAERWKAGASLSGRIALKQFLEKVYEYHNARDCRFDYSLRYSTDTDYREGREFFERFVYPGGGIRRVR